MSATFIQDVSNRTPKPFLSNLTIPTQAASSLARTPVNTPSSRKAIADLSEIEISHSSQSHSSITLFSPQKAATSYDYIGGNLVWLASKIARFFSGFWDYRWLDSNPQKHLTALVEAYKAHDWTRIETCITNLNRHTEDFLFEKKNFYAIEYALGRTLFSRILLHEIKKAPIKEAVGFALIRNLLQAKYGEGFLEPSRTAERDIFEHFFLSLLSRKDQNSILNDSLLMEIAWEDLSFEFEVALHPHQAEEQPLPAAPDVADDLLALGYPKTVLAHILSQHSEHIFQRIANKHPSTATTFFTKFFSRIIEISCDQESLRPKELEDWIAITSNANMVHAITTAYQKKLSRDIQQLGVTDQVTGIKYFSDELASHVVRKVNSEILEELATTKNRQIATFFSEKKNDVTQNREEIIQRIQRKTRKIILQNLKTAFAQESAPFTPFILALDQFLKTYDEYEVLRETLLADIDAHSALNQSKALELLLTKNKNLNLCTKVYKETLIDNGSRITRAIGQTNYAARLKEIDAANASLEQLGFTTMSARISA